MNFVVIDRARYNESPIPFFLMLLLDLVAIKEENGEYFLMKNRGEQGNVYVDKEELFAIINKGFSS